MLPFNINEENAARIRKNERRIERLETLEAAGAGCLSLIEHIELSGATSEIIFSSIPQIYKHLWIIHSVNGPFDFGDGSLHIQFNGDTGANYRWLSWRQSSTPVESVNSADNTTSIIVAQEGSISQFSAGQILVPYYVKSSRYTMVESVSFSAASKSQLGTWGGVWQDNSAVAAIRFFLTVGAGAPNMFAGSIISLYGLC